MWTLFSRVHYNKSHQDEGNLPVVPPTEDDTVSGQASQWPPKPISSVNDADAVEAYKALLTGHLWLDALLGMVAGVVSFPLLMTVVFNPVIGKMLSHLNRNLPDVLGWCFAASTHLLLYYKQRHRYPTLTGLTLLGAVLSGLLLLLTILLFWGI